jgi:ankyrin repeat protein
MSDAYDIKATLNIYMQVEDTLSYDSTLLKTDIHLNLLVDPLGLNVFHDIANSMLREDLLKSFFEIFMSHLKRRYPESSSQIAKEMLNSQSFNERRTPLLFAVQHNRMVRNMQILVKEFLLLGADPRIKDYKRQGPLHVAASLGRVSIFVYLQSFGLDLEELDGCLRTPLHHSAVEGEENMSLLILAWARKNINLQDENGQTPLHLASISRSYKITRHLLINGAHKKIRDKEGKTALDYAIESESHQQIKILVKPT